MKLELRTRHLVVHPGVRELCERHLLFSLGRFEEHVRRVQLWMEDVNGPRGGIDHVIRIIVRLTSGGKIVVRHQALDTYTGAPIAIERALRAVRRELGRRRNKRRQAYRRNLVERSRP